MNLHLAVQMPARVDMAYILEWCGRHRTEEVLQCLLGEIEELL